MLGIGLTAPFAVLGIGRVRGIDVLVLVLVRWLAS